MNIDIEKLANEFIFSDRGRELNAFINDNQGQMSANKLLREVFKAGYKAKKVNMNNTPIDIEKLAEEHLTPFARTGWAAYGEQIKQFAEAYSAKVLEKQSAEIAQLKEKFKSYKEESLNEIVSLNKTCSEYQANINDLREALFASDGLLRELTNSGGLFGLAIMENNQLVLSKTPAQSLIEHENATIEKCAEIVWFYEWISKEASEALISKIRALKGNT